MTVPIWDAAEEKERVDSTNASEPLHSNEIRHSNIISCGGGSGRGGLREWAGVVQYIRVRVESTRRVGHS